MMKRIAVMVMMAVMMGPAALAADLDSRLWESKEILKEYMQMPEQDRIPSSLLKSAKAVAIFPNMIKAGFVVAGQYGDGVVLVKDEATGEWSAPAFFRMSGGSVGFQIGGQASDAVLVITNERGVRGFLENKFTLGADASVSAGPVGRDAEGKTDWQMKSSVYSYSRSRGLFAGVALDGMVINEDRGANTSYYGSGGSAESILMRRSVRPTEKGQDLITTLAQYTA